MSFEKRVVVDCRGHILGRLASVIAKQLINGQKVVAVRCEEINITGRLIRNKFKYLAYLRKKTRYNPTRGHHHFRAPSKILWRTVRGMLPHKTRRGALALARLKVFDGTPPPYDKCKKVVVPDALRILRLKPMRKITMLGRLSSEVGWKHGDTVKMLEEKRKIKAAAWYARKKQLGGFRAAALKTAQDMLPEDTNTLSRFGY